MSICIFLAAFEKLHYPLLHIILAGWKKYVNLYISCCFWKTPVLSHRNADARWWYRNSVLPSICHTSCNWYL